MTLSLLGLLGKAHILVDSLNDVKEMHKECLEMFDFAWDALEGKDVEKAHMVLGKDERIDDLEVKVREEVLTYLESMPAGGNVPLSLILIDSANQFERMADHICFMADSAIKYPCMADDSFSDMLREEKSLAHSMLKSVSVALDTCDEKTAERVLGQYEEVKKVYERIIYEVDGSDLPVHRAVGLILVSRNLLRIAKKSKCIMEFCLKPYPEAGN
ncbi:MAG: PhoU domain-containing protein [Candidatus Altiarchaeota archaeon]